MGTCSSQSATQLSKQPCTPGRWKGRNKEHPPCRKQGAHGPQLWSTRPWQLALHWTRRRMVTGPSALGKWTRDIFVSKSGQPTRTVSQDLRGLSHERLLTPHTGYGGSTQPPQALQPELQVRESCGSSCRIQSKYMGCPLQCKAKDTGPQRSHSLQK